MLTSGSFEFQEFAEKVLTKTAWAYYRSTGDDEYTYWENFESFKRFWFRPRVYVFVSSFRLDQFAGKTSVEMHNAD